MRGEARSGPDPSFPILGEDERIDFPDPARNPPDDWIVALGGNLSPGMLLSAYEQGIFPWYNQEDPLIWQSPDPRFVIYPDHLHVSASMEKILRQNRFTLSFDRDFRGVIEGCASVERPGQGGTWISEDIIQAYTALHELGWAHSAEAYRGDLLVGGCYGIRLGRAFFGESMFHREANASKAAFLHLARQLFADQVALIDCQAHTDHLATLGGEELPRRRFLAELRSLMAERQALAPAERDTYDRRGRWG